MQRIKAWVRHIFGFSRTETNGFLILLPLIFLILLSAPAYRWWVASAEANLPSDREKLDSLISALQWDTATTAPVVTLFPFNPNTATKEELLDLGINGMVVNRIITYRNKGGRYRVKNDLKKMYGLDSSVFAVLSPYIKLPDRLARQVEPTVIAKPFTSTRKEKFDLNTADTLQLQSVFGIGTVRAARIVKFRTKLGGFISFDQLNEVYGLDTATQRQLITHSFIAPGFTPVPLKLNTATEAELATHPYLNYKLARAITTYRFQHGRFEAIEDLQRIAVIKEELYHKIKPYLSLD